MTLTDTLEAEMFEVKNLTPILVELVEVLDRLPAEYFGEWKGRKDAIRWHEKLANMRAIESLSEEDGAQLKFDTEMNYNDFHAQLERVEGL
jgi:hypothetical protein